MVPEHEQLFVFGAAQSVQDHGDAAGMARRPLGQQRRQQQIGDPGGGLHRLVADTGLAMDAQAQGQAAGFDPEQRRRLPGQGAAVEGHAEGHAGGIGAPGHRLDRVEVQPGFGGGAGDLEDQQIARHAAALAALGQTGAGHVVGHRQNARVDALGAQPLGGGAKVQHVAGVIAKAQDHAAAALRRPRHACHRAGRGRGEDIARHRRIGKPRADIAQKGRVMARAAADQQRHLAARPRRCAQRAMRHRAHPVAMRGAKARKRGGGKSLGVVEQPGHGFLLPARMLRI